MRTNLLFSTVGAPATLVVGLGLIAIFTAWLALPAVPKALNPAASLPITDELADAEKLTAEGQALLSKALDMPAAYERDATSNKRGSC